MIQALREELRRKEIMVETLEREKIDIQREIGEVQQRLVDLTDEGIYSIAKHVTPFLARIHVYPNASYVRLCVSDKTA